MKNLDVKQINTEKQIFPALSGFRNIAWLIFIYHFIPFDNPKYPLPLKNFIAGFQMSIDMFFVLSGFLITYRYFDQKPLNFKKYMINRFARIYPMYFLLTAAVFIVWYLQNQYWNNEKTIEAIVSFTLTKSLFKDYYKVGIPQGWSLTLEEIFYFCAPMVFILVRKSKWWLLFSPLILVIVGVFLQKISIKYDLWGGFMQGNFMPYFFDFFVGIALAVMIKTKKINPLKFPVATTLGIIYVVFYFAVRNYLGIDFRNPFNRSLELILFSSLGTAPIIWGLMFEKSLLQRLLSLNFMVLLGKSSYVFYLIHKGWIPIFLYEHLTQNFFFIFVILNIMAVALFHFMEEPTNNWIKRKFGSSLRKPGPKTVNA